MILPLQITFRNMEASPAVAARIRSEAEKLDRYYKRITSCRVVVEAPHRHHKWGEAFHILIELGVPGEEIVVKHAPSLHRALARSDTQKWVKHLEAGAPHKDMYVTIHDAFKATRRRLEDYVRRLRGDVKIHARVPPERADKLHSEKLAGL
ncbi:MAG: ribosome-associated translation inhibitor RaiA [Verrucomicrobia bacterium]|nr:ribosome-associated translation inhibitor RaiA [Verrucomicrobiota bacterium]